VERLERYVPPHIRSQGVLKSHGYPDPVNDPVASTEAAKSKLPGHDIADIGLAAEGKRRIEWAEREMPVLRLIRERFERERPLEGLRLAACLHVTTETANLVRTLKAGGAEVVLCASNPLSTQDETAAALVAEYGISTYARHGADRDMYYKHLNAAADIRPHMTMDDGCDLVTLIHQERRDQLSEIFAGTEETTTGVIRLKAMAADGALGYPVVAVNEALTKHLFDNRYGTGQSTLDGIMRATNLLIAGATLSSPATAGAARASRLVSGHGRPGRRGRSRSGPRSRGADGRQSGDDHRRSGPLGDIFVTATGDIHVIRAEHFKADARRRGHG